MNATRGVNTVTFPDGSLINVACDMRTDEGGWMVFQNRFDGSVDFERSFAEYENDFGDVNGEYWLGLKYIKQMTTMKTSFSLEVTSVSGESLSEFYYYMTLSGEDYNLILQDDYHDEAFDPRTENLAYSNYAPFSIFDQNTFKDCAGIIGGGWWYFQDTCGGVNLNGKYGHGGGFYHKGLHGNQTLKTSRMMILR